MGKEDTKTDNGLNLDDLVAAVGAAVQQNMEPIVERLTRVETKVEMMGDDVAGLRKDVRGNGHGDGGMTGDLREAKALIDTLAKRPPGWIAKVGIPIPWLFAFFVVALAALLAAGYWGLFDLNVFSGRVIDAATVADGVADRARPVP